LNGLVKDLEDKGQEFKKKVVQVKKSLKKKPKISVRILLKKPRWACLELRNWKKKAIKPPKNFSLAAVNQFLKSKIHSFLLTASF